MSSKLQRHADILWQKNKAEKISTLINFGQDMLMLVALVEERSEDKLKAIAEQVQKKITIELALQLRGKYDFEALVDVQKRIGICCRSRVKFHSSIVIAMLLSVQVYSIFDVTTGSK